MGIFNFRKLREVSLENNRKILSKPSENKLPTDPWGNYSILFMGDYFEPGKATKSMLKLIIDLEDIIADIRNRNESQIVTDTDILLYKANTIDNKLDKAEIILKCTNLDNNYLEKILSLTSIDKKQLHNKYESIKQVHINHLMNNLRFEFTNVYHNLNYLEDIYTLCLVLDILTGELPDIYNEDNQNDYGVDIAKDIYEKFPIKGSEEGKAEEKGYNIVIAAYCHSECTFTNLQLSIEMLLELLDIKEFPIKDINNIDIYKVFKRSGVDINSIHKRNLDLWVMGNREMSRFINMMEYTLNRRVRLTNTQQYLKDTIYNIGEYSYIVDDGFKVILNSDE